MREDPIISKGLAKVLAVIAVLGIAGFGAYRLIDKIDLPETDPSSVVTLGDTELSDTTINGPNSQELIPGGDTSGPDVISTAGLARALGRVRPVIGAGSTLTQVSLNDLLAQFIRLRGDKAESYAVAADTGAVTRTDATITVTGAASVADFAFPLKVIKPAAVDRILRGARKLVGGAKLVAESMILQRSFTSPARLGWSLNARAGKRNYTFSADVAGRHVEGVGSSVVPEAVIRAQKLNDCIQAASSNSDEIFACLDRFKP